MLGLAGTSVSLDLRTHTLRTSPSSYPSSICGATKANTSQRHLQSRTYANMVSMRHRVQLIATDTPPAGPSDAQLNELVTGAQLAPLGPTPLLDRPSTVPSTPRSTFQQKYTVNRGDVLAAGSQIVKKLEKRESDGNVLKDEVAAWLDEHKVRVLPGEVKESLYTLA